MNFNDNSFQQPNTSSVAPQGLTGLNSFSSQIRTMAAAGDKVQALSYLARYQNQMSQQECLDALADIKAIDPSSKRSIGDLKPLSKEDPMKNYQQTVDALKNIERNRW